MAYSMDLRLKALAALARGRGARLVTVSSDRTLSPYGGATMACSMDLRLKALEAIDRGRGTTAEVARVFGVSPQWLNGLLRLRRATRAAAFSAPPRGRRAA